MFNRSESVQILYVADFPKKRLGMYEYLVCWISELRTHKGRLSLITSDDKIGNRIPADLQKKIISPLYNSYILLSLPVLYLFIGRFVFRLLRHIPVNKNETIYIPNSSLVVDLLIADLISRGCRKIIYTFHDPVPHDERGSRFYYFLKKRSYQRLFRLYMQHNSLYFHIHHKGLIKDLNLDLQRIIEYPHPLPPMMTRSNRIKDGTMIHLGFMGRIENYKGIDVLFEALNLCSEYLKKHKDRIVLKIVGNNNTDFNLSLFTKLGIQTVIRDGNVSAMEFHQTMADLDVLILPYKSATQSGVMMMGLSYQIPMICTKVGALAEMAVGESNILIEPNRPDLLALSMTELINEKIGSLRTSGRD
jgi:glycosyltransferase involved in cell wall biosynthesis